MAGHAFWSYSRADDDHDEGRIARFARAVKEEFETISGESLTLFLDRDSLSWGDDWQERIANAVNEAVFFVPVITPRYFKSAACREEFRTFVTKARQLGITERILTIIYIDVPDLGSKSGDELKRWATTYQYRKLTELRWLDPDSREFTRAANSIAQELASLEASLPSDVEQEAREVITGTDLIEGGRRPDEVTPPTSSYSSSGYAELVSGVRQTLPSVVKAIRICKSALAELIGATSRDLPVIENAPTASAKVALLARFADETREVERRLSDGSEDFVSAVDDIDSGVQAVFHWPDSELSRDDMDLRGELAGQILTIRAESNALRDKLDELRRLLGRLMQSSKAVKASVADIDNSLIRLIDGQALVEGWSPQQAK
jgi:hypothetical protein